ncbi:hypothetical protein JCM8208_000229 [Rhodotorula glutinis]
MSLAELPAELVAHVARFLPRADQARLSLINKVVRSSVQHELYRDVELDIDTLYDADFDEYLAGTARPRDAVASLANDPARCALIRRFAVKDHGSWIDQDTADNICTVLRQAPLLDDVGFLQTSQEYVDDLDAMPDALIRPVWDILPHLSTLRRLTIHAGPVAALNLHKLEHLRELNVEISDMTGLPVGTLPSSLEVLSLAAVEGFPATWFSPSLFAHLRSLTLYHLEAAEIQIIEHALEMYARSSRPSTLSHLHLDLHPYELQPHGPDQDAADSALVIRVLRAFKPLADSVVHLEVATSPAHPYLDESSPTIAASVIEAVTSSFASVKHLRLFIGIGGSFWPYPSHDLMHDLLLGIARCTQLRRLETNVYRHTRATRRLESEHEPDEARWVCAVEEAVALSAALLLDRLPSLDTVVLSPDESLVSAKAFVRSDDGVGAPRLVAELDLPRGVA